MFNTTSLLEEDTQIASSGKVLLFIVLPVLMGIRSDVVDCLLCPTKIQTIYRIIGSLWDKKDNYFPGCLPSLAFPLLIVQHSIEGLSHAAEAACSFYEAAALFPSKDYCPARQAAGPFNVLLLRFLKMLCLFLKLLLLLLHFLVLRLKFWLLQLVLFQLKLELIFIIGSCSFALIISFP